MSRYLLDDDGYLPLYAPAPAQQYTPMAWPVRCAACPARTEYHGYGVVRAYGQIDLWMAGWRREPESGADYCPAHVPAAVAALGGPRCA